DHAVFDKTGTLTMGAPAVTRHTLGAADLEAAAALASGSRHPVSRAVAAFASHPGPVPVGLREVAGQGMEGSGGGHEYRLGSRQWVTGGQEADDAGDAAAWLSKDGRCVGFFSTADRLRPGAAAAMKSLGGMGVGVEVLSGDREAEVGRIRASLGIEDATSRA